MRWLRWRLLRCWAYVITPWINYRRAMWNWEHRHLITHIRDGVPTERPRVRWTWAKTDEGI